MVSDGFEDSLQLCVEIEQLVDEYEVAERPL
jgi:hypothetical protein